MRLHLLLDSNIHPHVNKGDVLLLNTFSEQKEGLSGVKMLDVNIANEAILPIEEVKELFQQFDTAYNNIINDAYVRLFHPIYVVLANVEQVLSENDIDEIVLYGGGDSPFFICEGGEGEGCRKNYKSNWLVNSFVFSKYRDIYTISWISKQNILLISLYNLYRRNVNYVKFCFTRIVKWFLQYIRGYVKANFSEVSFVSVISLLLQKRHIDSLYKDEIFHNHVYLSYDRHLVDNKSVFSVKELSIKTLIKDCSRIMRLSHPPFLTIKNIKSKAIIKELKYLLFQQMILEHRLRESLSDIAYCEDIKMLSDTTIGMDMITIRNVARYYNMKHINMQYVVMGRVLYPELKLADEYYLYARKTYELYHEYSDSYKYFLPIKSDSHNKAKMNSSIDLVVFTQPDGLSKFYIEFLNTIIPEIDKHGDNIRIIIKPHYREKNLEGFKRIVTVFPFVSMASPNESVADLLNNADFAMSINSSVIFEAMMSSVPSIVYNPQNHFYNSIYLNDICYPEVNFVIEKASDAIELLRNPEVYRDVFTRRMDLFIQKSNAISNVCNILK